MVKVSIRASGLAVDPFRQFSEPGPPNSWGPCGATKILGKKIIGYTLKN